MRIFAIRENKFRYRRASLTFMASLLAGTSCLADQAIAQSAGAQVQNSAQIQEIIVSANRRKESLQKVPIAVSAVTAGQASKLGIVDGQSLAQAIPGLNFNRQANASIPFLRGVGSPVGEAGDEPSVAYYVDDVYMPAGAASLSNFNSIDHMEVEKGPQGTLFGRNATGGVIQVFTKDPSRTPELDTSLTIANYGTYSGAVYVSDALSSKFAANLAVYGSRQVDGWGHNTLSGDPTFTGHDFGGRAKLLFTPSDATSVMLTVDGDETRTGEGINYIEGPGEAAAAGFFHTGGYFDTNTAVNQYSLNRQYGVSLKVNHDFDWATARSISAYRWTRAFQITDEDVGPLGLVIVPITSLEKTVTQEFQLLSPNDSALKWIVGLFYFGDRASYQPLSFGGLAFSPPDNAYGIENTNSYSGFGQATDEILPDTHLTMGLRYTYDEKKLSSYGISGGVITDSPNSPQAANFAKVTYRISLDHQFTPQTMGYVAYNRGFKSGLFNPVVFPGAPIDPPVAPETLDSYTIGAKNEFFDHKLRINAEGFYYQYRNIQIDEVISGATHLTNAAAATIKGIDLDVTAKPLEHLTLTASAEIMDGHYASFPQGLFWTYQGPLAGGNASSQANLQGYKTIQTPPFSMNLSALYTIPTKYGPVDINGTWMHGGNYYFDADNGAGQYYPNDDRQAILNIINASVGWNSSDERYAVRLWAKNLTNQHYSAFTLEDAFATTYSPAPPLTFGVTFTTHL